MDDALLVGRATSGDLESFGQLFDQYYPRVFDFAWRTLGDPVAAAEATRDIFLQAARRLPQRTGGMAFRAWLFSLAFGAVVSSVAARAAVGGPLHEEAFGSFEVPDPARVTDPALIGNDHELAVLVWEALTSLTPRDRAILDLHVRQGLDSAAMAPVLGLNKRDAANLVDRMKRAASDVVLSYVIARRCSTACGRLEEVLAPFDMPPYTDAARRAVDTHIKDCTECSDARMRLVPPLEVYGALAAGEPPLEAKGDIWSAIAAGWAARRDPIADLAPESAGQSSGDGLSLSGVGGDGRDVGGLGVATGGWDRRQVFWFAGAAVGLIAFAFLAGFVATTALGGNGGTTQVLDSSTRTATATDTPARGCLDHSWRGRAHRDAEPDSVRNPDRYGNPDAPSGHRHAGPRGGDPNDEAGGNADEEPRRCAFANSNGHIREPYASACGHTHAADNAGSVATPTEL